jgi:pilus assembly protein Flp/PilA
MMSMIKLAALRLAYDRKGVTAIEYGLIAGAIAVAIIGAVVAIGSDITNMFDTAGAQLKTVSGAGK